MKLISLHRITGGDVLINANKIAEIFIHADEFHTRTRILFCFTIGDDYIYEDVKETMQQILNKL